MAVERRRWKRHMERARIVGSYTRRSVAEGGKSVHLLLDRKDLLAASSAFGLRHRWLKQFEELAIVFWTECIKKFL